MGRSGSGKSSLLRVLALIDRPTAGDITLDGVAIHPVSSPARVSPWPTVTVAFQQLFLWPHRTLRDNIELPARLRGVSIDALPSMSSELDLDDCLDRYPNEVSVGQQQRAALIRAILLRPHYLLLDEITSAQDVEQVSRLLGLLREQVQLGVALLVVTHHIGFARKLLSQSERPQFVFLKGGTVVETGTGDCLDRPATVALDRFLTTSRDIL